eukprot:TRINITY_DN2629_c0_g1_i3.p1 TRINITY_DN2629_c0_g1~~TRINITY_DN2629_c0_g1_i3.p1  ORF type:complete len:156 (-),score=15.43 TRINITY_DN2629_c0_g1_i3:23-490(-)
MGNRTSKRTRHDSNANTTTTTNRYLGRIVKNYQHIQPTKGEQLLLTWFNILRYEDLTASFISQQISMVRPLTLVSRYLTVNMSPHIEQNFYFSPSEWFRWYTPKNLKSISNLELIPSSVVLNGEVTQSVIFDLSAMKGLSLVSKHTFKTVKPHIE